MEFQILEKAREWGVTPQFLETAREWGITPERVGLLLFSSYRVAQQSTFSLPAKVMQVVAVSGILSTAIHFNHLSRSLSLREITSGALSLCKSYLDKRTPTIKSAAFAEDVAFLKYQAAQGVFNLEEQDHQGETPLVQAGDWRNEDAQIALIKAGSDVHAKDDLGNTALHYAAAMGKLNVLRTLIQYNANINETNLEDITPLHLAAGTCRKDCVEYLLAAGARTEILAKYWHGPIKNWYGTPLHLVLLKLDAGDIPLSGAKEILELLVKAGADPDYAPHLINLYNLDNDVANWKRQMQAQPRPRGANSP